MSAPNQSTSEAAEELKEVFQKEVGSYLLKAHISSDNLKVFIDVEPATQPPPADLIAPAAEELEKVLLDAGIKDCLQIIVLADIAKDLKAGKVCQKRRVAKGISPVSGKEGKLVYLVKRMGAPREIRVDEYGIADYSILHIFDNIVPEQIVARIYPPKPGQAGRDVYGKEIIAPLGEPAKYKIDSTLEEGEESGHSEYRILRSKQNGFLYQEGENLKVQHDLVVGGDLDYRFGSLDFIGKVVVSGDVMPGFNINSRDGIEVKGSVRGGSLVSTHGPIKVDGFVYGGVNSRVISGQSFTANIVQEVNAEIKGDITVIKEARDSMLRSESALRIEKGHLYGGRTLVVCGAECGILGSEVQTPTLVELVGDMEATVAFSQLKIRMNNHVKAIELIKLHLGPFVEDRKKLESLRLEHRMKMEALLLKLEKLEKSLKVLEKRKVDLLLSARTSNVKRINVITKMYPGVQIIVRESIFKTEQILPGPISIDFDLATSQFVSGPLKPLETSYKDEPIAPPTQEEISASEAAKEDSPPQTEEKTEEKEDK